MRKQQLKGEGGGDLLNRGFSAVFPLTHSPTARGAQPAAATRASRSPQTRGRWIGCLRGNRPELVRTFPGVPLPRWQLSHRGSEKSGGVTGTGSRQLCRAAEGES